MNTNKRTLHDQFHVTKVGTDAIGRLTAVVSTMCSGYISDHENTMLCIFCNIEEKRRVTKYSIYEEH